MKYLVLILCLVGCSDKYYLKKLAKHNPQILDSSVVYVPYHKDTSFYGIIPASINDTIAVKVPAQVKIQEPVIPPYVLIMMASTNILFLFYVYTVKF